MRSLFTRLLAGGAAYQASSVLSAVLALVTLPLYTRALTRADFGVAETLLTFIILASILLRFGLGEAFVRFYFQTAEARARPPRPHDDRHACCSSRRSSRCSPPSSPGR